MEAGAGAEEASAAASLEDPGVAATGALEDVPGGAAGGGDEVQEPAQKSRKLDHEGWPSQSDWDDQASKRPAEGDLEDPQSKRARPDEDGGIGPLNSDEEQEGPGPSRQEGDEQLAAEGEGEGEGEGGGEGGGVAEEGEVEVEVEADAEAEPPPSALALVPSPPAAPPLGPDEEHLPMLEAGDAELLLQPPDRAVPGALYRAARSSGAAFRLLGGSPSPTVLVVRSPDPVRRVLGAKLIRWALEEKRSGVAKFNPEDRTADISVLSLPEDVDMKSQYLTSLSADCGIFVLRAAEEQSADVEGGEVVTLQRLILAGERLARADMQFRIMALVAMRTTPPMPDLGEGALGPAEAGEDWGHEIVTTETPCKMLPRTAKILRLATGAAIAFIAGACHISGPSEGRAAARGILSLLEGCVKPAGFTTPARIHNDDIPLDSKPFLSFLDVPVSFPVAVTKLNQCLGQVEQDCGVIVLMVLPGASPATQFQLVAANLAPPAAPGEAVEVFFSGRWQPGRMQAATGPLVKVEVDGKVRTTTRMNVRRKELPAVQASREDAPAETSTAGGATESAGAAVAPGDAVEVLYKSEWHAGTFREHLDGGQQRVEVAGQEYVVDASEVRPAKEASAAAPASAPAVPPALAEGDEVEALYRGEWYAGRVVKVLEAGQLQVEVDGKEYELGQDEVRRRGAAPPEGAASQPSAGAEAQPRETREAGALGAGDEVEVLYRGEWYAGTVAEALDAGRFRVRVELEEYEVEAGEVRRRVGGDTPAPATEAPAAAEGGRRSPEAPERGSPRSPPAPGALLKSLLAKHDDWLKQQEQQPKSPPARLKPTPPATPPPQSAIAAARAEAGLQLCATPATGSSQRPADDEADEAALPPVPLHTTRFLIIARDEWRRGRARLRMMRIAQDHGKGCFEEEIVQMYLQEAAGEGLGQEVLPLPRETSQQHRLIADRVSRATRCAVEVIEGTLVLYGDAPARSRAKKAMLWAHSRGTNFAEVRIPEVVVAGSEDVTSIRVPVADFAAVPVVAWGQVEADTGALLIPCAPPLVPGEPVEFLLGGVQWRSGFEFLFLDGADEGDEALTKLATAVLRETNGTRELRVQASNVRAVQGPGCSREILAVSWEAEARSLAETWVYELTSSNQARRYAASASLFKMPLTQYTQAASASSNANLLPLGRQQHGTLAAAGPGGCLAGLGGGAAGPGGCLALGGGAVVPSPAGRMVIPPRAAAVRGTTAVAQYLAGLHRPIRGVHPRGSHASTISILQQLQQQQMLLQQAPVVFNSKGFPMRPGQILCGQYQQSGSCRFMKNCKYDHPERESDAKPAAGKEQWSKSSSSWWAEASRDADSEEKPAKAEWSKDEDKWWEKPSASEEPKATPEDRGDAWWEASGGGSEASDSRKGGDSSWDSGGGADDWKAKDDSKEQWSWEEAKAPEKSWSQWDSAGGGHSEEDKQEASSEGQQWKWEEAHSASWHRQGGSASREEAEPSASAGSGGGRGSGSAAAPNLGTPDPQQSKAAREAQPATPPKRPAVPTGLRPLIPQLLPQQQPQPQTTQPQPQTTQPPPQQHAPAQLAAHPPHLVAAPTLQPNAPAPQQPAAAAAALAPASVPGQPLVAQAPMPIAGMAAHPGMQQVAAQQPPPGMQTAEPGGWKRMESRKAAGVFYYYNTETGDSQPEPPPPWERRESRSQAGLIYYWNSVTNETSMIKPEL